MTDKRERERERERGGGGRGRGREGLRARMMHIHDKIDLNQMKKRIKNDVNNLPKEKAIQ